MLGFPAVTKPSPLAAVLRERSSEILAAWIVRFERSPLRFRRAAKAASHAAQVASVLEALTEAASDEPGQLRPGSEMTRELERSAAFLGAQFASDGATGFDVAALLLELRDVVAGMTFPDAVGALTQLFEWLTVVALDGFAASGLQSLREQVADQLEAGTPVCELLPKVPAVLLVGAPSSNLIDNLLARGWMLAVGTGAPCLIIDCAGLADAAERAFERGFRSFVAQSSRSAVHLLLSSASAPVTALAAEAAEGAGLAFLAFERLDLAVVHAVERTGYVLVRRS